MKGAIIHNIPYHKSFGLSLAVGEIGKRVDYHIPYIAGKEQIDKEVDKLKDIDFIIAWMNPLLSEIDSLSRLGKPVILASCDTWKRLSDDWYKKVVEHHKATGKQKEFYFL